MTNWIITMDICQIPTVNSSLNVGRMKTIIPINWIVNIAMPDSIIMNMMDRIFVLAPPKPKVRFSQVRPASLYTLRILNTIRPVIAAFTIMEMPRLVGPRIVPKAVYRRPMSGLM